MRNALTLATLFALSGCFCGDVVVVDEFAVSDNSKDLLHTYAANSRVTLRVHPGLFGYDVTNLGRPDISGNAENNPNEEGDQIGDGIEGEGIPLLLGEPGDAEIQLEDKDGNAVGAPRVIEIVEVDEIRISPTAPTNTGIDLPEVDPTNLRILANSEAAMRVSTFSGGDEVFGLGAVISSQGARDCFACAEDTCGAKRNALEFDTFFGEPTDNVLTAGSAELTVRIVPTEIAEITDIVISDEGRFEDRNARLATVLVGDEPVFGAPLQWLIDGDVLEDEDDFELTGDVLQYTPSPSPRAVIAQIGDKQSAQAVVSGSDFETTSITFACGASAAGGPMCLLLLGLLRRRRRSTR